MANDAFQTALETIAKNQAELTKAITEFVTVSTTQFQALRDAVIYLATAMAQQERINAKKLADDYSQLIELNHGQDENLGMPLLDVRATLYKIATGE